MVSQKIFKAYDIRGTYPREINETVAFKVGAALIEFLRRKLRKDNLKIAVGRDCRLSSDSLFKAFCQGAFSRKGEIIDIGLVSTDTLYFALGYFKYDGGVMITASHNPKQDNGFKMVVKGLKFIFEDWGMEEIRELVNKAKVIKGKIKGKIVKKNIIPVYAKYILKSVDLKDIKPLKAVVDAGNGMGGIIIKEMAGKIPVRLYPLHFQLNGNFPNHYPDPTIKKNLKDCRKEVVKRKADFGLAFDGDGDRTVFINEKGKAVNESVALAIFSQYFLKQYPGQNIVYNSVCSRIVPEIIRKFGGHPVKARTGRPFVRKKSLKNKVVFGGEKSGHLFFRRVFYSESGGLAFLLMLKILSQAERKLSELARPFEKYHQLSANLKIKDKQKAIKKLTEFYQREKKSRFDGLTIRFKDWWFNVRPSNTEALLRITVESGDEKTTREKLKQIKKIIKDEPR